MKELMNENKILSKWISNDVRELFTSSVVGFTEEDLQALVDTLVPDILDKVAETDNLMPSTFKDAFTSVLKERLLLMKTLRPIAQPQPELNGKVNDIIKGYRLIVNGVFNYELLESLLTLTPKDSSDSVTIDLSKIPLGDFAHGILREGCTCECNDSKMTIEQKIGVATLHSDFDLSKFTDDDLRNAIKFDDCTIEDFSIAKLNQILKKYQECGLIVWNDIEDYNENYEMPRFILHLRNDSLFNRLRNIETDLDNFDGRYIFEPIRFDGDDETDNKCNYGYIYFSGNSMFSLKEVTNRLAEILCVYINKYDTFNHFM